MTGPMQGVKVVEMGVWVAGPAAGGILADWGADVVKIEPPGVGDPGRLFTKMIGGDLPFNPPFEMDNRGKRSIVLDLALAPAREMALELIDGADVFLSNMRTSALERLGLDSASLLARNPRLVYASVTGYGMEGPDADRAAYDIAAFWSRSGVAASLTAPGGQPPFQRGGMGDHGAGLSAAAAISAALFDRERTGQGRLVATSLLRQGIYTLSFDYSIAMRFGTAVGSADRTQMPNVSVNCYRDREGQWFWIVGLEAERHWPPLARAVGHPEWIEDPLFSTPEVRAQNAPDLIARLDAIFAEKSREEWADIFASEEDLWWSPVQTVEQALADPQVRAAGGFVEVPDGETVTLLPATPVDFDGRPCEPRAMAPEPGEHTDEILSELGYGPEEVAKRRQDGWVS